MELLHISPLMIAGIVILLAIAFFLKQLSENEGGEQKKSLYRYKSKQFAMTKNEHDCYDALLSAVGDKYHVFPQQHLDVFIDQKVVGQNWKAAWKHINQKSVDFLLCDKTYLNPKLAIELDDSTHERPDRIVRDTEVERILVDAKFPLLRITHFDLPSSKLLKQKIYATLLI